MSLSPRSRRRDVRRARPKLMVAVCGLRLTTRDWSLGGLALEVGRRAVRRLGLGDEVRGTLADDVAGTPERPFTATVVRRDRVGGIVALRFCHLPGETFTMLERLLLHPQPAQPGDVASDSDAAAAGGRPARVGMVLQDLYDRPVVYSAERYAARQSEAPREDDPAPRRRRRRRTVHKPDQEPTVPASSADSSPEG